MINCIAYNVKCVNMNKIKIMIKGLVSLLRFTLEVPHMSLKLP